MIMFNNIQQPNKMIQKTKMTIQNTKIGDKVLRTKKIFKKEVKVICQLIWAIWIKMKNKVKAYS